MSDFALWASVVRRAWCVEAQVGVGAKAWAYAKAATRDERRPQKQAHAARGGAVVLGRRCMSAGALWAWCCASVGACGRGALTASQKCSRQQTAVASSESSEKFVNMNVLRSAICRMAEIITRPGFRFAPAPSL
ncbi:hypothetical protein B0H19DRAFT_1059474 [Mycena capillaripes]|nr:hypothetical protein B0H19DRAFT_1059474 [Mycena capillaripes]